MKTMIQRIGKAICLTIMLAWSVSAQAFTLTQNPTTCSTVTGIGSVAWTNPGNALATDNSYATSAPNDNQTTNYLECTGYNFAIPDGATINGITVSVERKSGATTAPTQTQDALVRLMKAGVIGTTDRSTTTAYTTGDVTENHGGAADLWGTTWSASDVRNSNFGVAFAAQKVGTNGNAITISVDVIQITIDYSIPSMSCTQPSNTPAGMVLSCVCDNFGRSALNPSTIYNSNWTASTSDLTSIVPSIANPGYLRLTNNTGNNAKAVTVPGIFPAAGNYISVEFQHFAYNGSNPGADGIAVTLSDYSISPVPGAFGGSLGYAQKTGTACTSSGATTCPGFAGGWIGVALDEWGNYQNPTEGRIGGPGAVSESVGVRGSGSGVNNYNWLAGTNSLTTKIDNPTSAVPSPGYYYQVIVDARNSSSTGQTFVAVNRDTSGTGSSYASLINSFDVFSTATTQGFTQNAVPDNWQISFTGSTGGANNIHEIGGLRICAQTVAPPSGGTASGFAVIDEAYGTPPSVAVQNYLNGHIYMKLVGVPFKLDVAAISNSQILTTYAAGASKNVTVKLVDNTSGTCVLDSSQANYCNSACTTTLPAVTGGTQTLVFNSGNAASPPEKGQKQTASFTLNSAYKNLVAIVSDGTTNACSVDSFSVRPTTITSVTSSNATNTGSTGTPTLKAGSANLGLTATVGGVTGVANGYTGTLKIDSNAIKATVPSGGTAGTISPGTFPSATSGTTTATATGSTFAYSEAGGFNFVVASCSDATGATCSRGVYDGVNYLECGSTSSATCDPLKPSTWSYVDSISSKNDCVFGSYSNTIDSSGKYGCNFGIGSSTSTFGRFIPAKFAVSAATLTPACSSGAGFTYMGAPFTASFTLTAQNASGTTTKNYQGALASLAPPNAASWLSYGATNTMGLWMVAPNYAVTGGTCTGVFSSVAGTTSYGSCSVGATAPSSVPRTLGPRVTIPSNPAAPVWSNGTANFSASLQLERADTADGPYGTVSIGIAPQDNDNVVLGVFDLDVDNNGTNERGALRNASNAIVTMSERYGRLRIDNVYGSELLNAPVSVTAEYWNNPTSLYVKNTDDSCTALSSSNMVIDTPLKGISSAGAVSLSSGATLSGGTGTLLVAKPSPTPTTAGSVDLSTGLAYLPGKGRIMFGTYKGAPIIYLRELY